jgi:hypothetical protein
MILDLNGSFSFPPIHQRRVLIELYSGKTTSAPQPRTSLFAMSEGRLSYRFLTSFYNTDAPGALYDLSDNYYNKDVSLSFKL